MLKAGQTGTKRAVVGLNKGIGYFIWILEHEDPEGSQGEIRGVNFWGALLAYVGNTYKVTGGKNDNTVNRYQHFN